VAIVTLPAGDGQRRHWVPWLFGAARSATDQVIGVDREGSLATLGHDACDKPAPGA
jgi:hypothetical protein